MGIKDLAKFIIQKNILPTSLILRCRALFKPKQKKLLEFEVHLCDHCNLNCTGCDHFSPLANKTFLDAKCFEQDCTRLAELTNGKIDAIRLLGGEPLLHPDLCSIIPIARHSFPTAAISVVTNGVLLLKQSEEFWQCCHENNVTITTTKYPINLDYDAIDALAETHGVTLEYWGGVTKTTVHYVLDTEGTQNPQESYKLCFKSNACIQLKEGKLYTCATIPYIKYFNQHFNKDLQVTENDYIDIYKAKDIDEILAFLSKPMPFCRYCNVENTGFGLKWGLSKKEISEWV